MHALFTYEGGYRGTVLHMIMVSWPAVIFQAVLFDDNQRTSSYNIELVNATTKMLQLGFNLDSRDSNEQTVLRINRIWFRNLLWHDRYCLPAAFTFNCWDNTHQHETTQYPQIIFQKYCLWLSKHIDPRDNMKRTPLRLAIAPDSTAVYQEFQRPLCHKLIQHGAGIYFCYPPFVY